MSGNSQRVAVVLSTALLLFLFVYAHTAEAGSPTVPLDAPKALAVQNGRIEIVSYRGRKALHLQPLPGQENTDGSILAVVAGSDFRDGVIEVDVAGAPRVGVAPSNKGFIGLAFRLQNEGKGTELIYLRPSNGRSDDQLVRNHSVQYVSDPDYGWERLRKETPGKYESYTDLEPGVWTHMKIEIAGTKARLYINGATQPCLVVSDLKRGESHGQIALWAHPTTEAYFANLAVR